MNVITNENLKQFLLLALIILLTVVLGRQVIAFLPGVLGGVTMYILMREYFFRLTVVKNWKKWMTATLFIIFAIVVFVLPIAVCAQLLLPKFYDIIHDPEQMNRILGMVTVKLQQIIPQLKVDQAQIEEMMQKGAASVPGFLTATAAVVTNLVLAFFLLYFMLVDGRKMERKLQKFIPFKEDNIDNIWEATRVMVVSNAIGIPVLALSQALVATIGYAIFGIEDPIMWGIITGIFSILPIVGSAIIWAPLSIFLFLTDHVSAGIGLLLFSAVITSSADNVLRFTLLKKLGDVHPIITVFGVIVGIPLFGFMGLIFGPLLISYLLLLVQIYRVEFSTRSHRNGTEKY
ncbi:MAG: AI-2E family transporter [Sphingobacteriales bacterium]|nr:MAG: AI-2E family transporter [Sphingobacteriales bacterium]